MASKGRSTHRRNRHRKAISRNRPPCALCGQPIDYNLLAGEPKSFVVDHIIPLDKGGKDELGNCQAAHWDCNRQKSNKIVSPVIKRSGALID